jgi:hypothetical protein
LPVIQSAVVACDETISIMVPSFICALLYRLRGNPGFIRGAYRSKKLMKSTRL